MPGSFMCSCKKGFHAKQSSAVGCNCTETEIESSGSSENTSNKSDTILCRDMNECMMLLHDCHENATCTNLVGSFQCHCNEGFTGDGRKCQRSGSDNLNKCDLELHNCDSNAECVDEEGSYDCECKNGFIGDGVFCTDVDECISDPCGANTECSNVIGSFRCSCKEGYKMVNGSNQIGAILCKKNISVGKSDPSNEETIEWKLPVVVAAAVLAIVLLAIIVFLVYKKRSASKSEKSTWISKDVTSMTHTSNENSATDTINDE